MFQAIWYFVFRIGPFINIIYDLIKRYAYEWYLCYSNMNMTHNTNKYETQYE